MQWLSKALRESPAVYKAPLTGSYTVILTVGDMYATDVLILLCGSLTCNELTARWVACSP